MSLADVWEDIHTVGRALGVSDRARELVGKLRDELDDLTARVAHAGTRPSLACLEWIDPLMSAGNWVPELAELAGGRNLLGQAGKHSPWLNWDRLLRWRGDVI